VGLGNQEVLVTTQDGYVSRSAATINLSTFRIMTGTADGTGPPMAMNDAKETSGAFDVVTPENFGPDKRTRLRILATGVSGSAANSNPANDISDNGVPQPNLAESVKVEARLADGRVFNLPVEYAGAERTLPGLDKVNIVLLPEMRGAGTVELTIVIGGWRSNSPAIVVQ
jgi:uncharacterized protein (TIGR03437 family)